MLNIIDAPMLDIDKTMFERFGNVVSENGKLERKIVANVLQYCIDNDFNLISVYDSVELTSVDSVKEAMELIFNLDEAFVYVYNQGYNQHWVRFNIGEGEDVFSDFSFSEDDEDGFKKLMDCFDVEKIS